MPRKKQAPKKVITTTEEVIEEPEIQEPIPVLDPGELELTEIAQSLGEDGLKIQVSVLKNGGWGYVADLDKKDLDLAQIQRRFARHIPPDGAEFKLDIKKDGVLRLQKRLLIFPPDGVAPIGGGPTYGGMEHVMERILDRLERIETRPQSNIGEFAQLYQTVKENAAPPPDPLANMSGMLGLMQTMMSFVKESAGVSAEKPWWQEVITHPAVAPVLAPAITGLLSGFLQKPNGQPQIPVQPEAPAVIQEDPLKAQIKGILGYLKTQVTVGPDAFVDMILGNQHDPNAQHLIRLICTESFEYFTQIDAEIGQPPYDIFFRAIYDGIRSDLQGPNSMATDPGGPHGNKGNPATHAKPNGQSKQGRQI
jgi:hypothetical protein